MIKSKSHRYRIVKLSLVFNIWFVYLLLSSLAIAETIYRDIYNKLALVTPSGWILESQSFDPVVLLLKQSEDAKLGENPIIYITKIDPLSAMPKNIDEVKQLTEQLQNDSSSVNNFKVTDWKLSKNEESDWFSYTAQYQYIPKDKPKNYFVKALTMVVKNGGQYYSVMLITPKKYFKSSYRATYEVAESLQTLFLPNLSP